MGRIKQVIYAAVAVALVPAQALAAGYGVGNYNGGTYQGATAAAPVAGTPVTIPGIGTLPVTGENLLLMLGSATLLGLGGGLVMWTRQRRQARA